MIDSSAGARRAVRDIAHAPPRVFPDQRERQDVGLSLMVTFTTVVRNGSAQHTLVPPDATSARRRK